MFDLLNKLSLLPFVRSIDLHLSRFLYPFLGDGQTVLCVAVAGVDYGAFKPALNVSPSPSTIS